MSHFLDRLTFFRKNVGTFSGKHGVVTNEDRQWEEAYRRRWQHDKIVRSTHGVNCTGSCSWKIYVKGGIVTWETQQTDYPRTRPDMPNHEPRGCARGASYSWYLYSANRVKYPLVRRRLIELWRAERRTKDPVEAWAAIVEDPAKAKSYKQIRGLGGFVRAKWDEVEEVIAAANVYTAKRYGPDRIAGFSPIPAMSMVSYAAGSRYLSLIGGVCMSFYDWYCDLPPSSPQTWGEQTDVPESADWYNSTFLILWGSNVPQTRTPDAHFYTEVRYKGAKSVVITPDYSEAAKFGDLWLHPKQGTDAALAMAMGHVILKEFHLAGRSAYFEDYCRRFTDLPMLVVLEKRGNAYVPGRFLRAADLDGALDQANNPDWKTLAFNRADGSLALPNGSIGFRWGESGKWNIEEKDARSGAAAELQLSLAETRDAVVPVAFPYFGGHAPDSFHATKHDEVMERNLPVRRLATRAGETYVATVFDLLVGNYGIDRGLGGGNVAASYDEDQPYTPAWAEAVTGVPRDHIITTARQFAENADKTQGKSMVILGAGLNHWYHMDMIYRGIINMLVMCGCVGQSGGGWSHYVGPGKTAAADRLDGAGLRARLEPAAPADEFDLVLLRPHLAMALREARSDGDPVAARRCEGFPDQPDRLQRQGRADGVAAIGAAARNQSAGPGRGGRGRRQSRARLCRRGFEGRNPALRRRGSGRAGQPPAQPLRLALEPAGRFGQGPRVFPEIPAWHRSRRAGKGHGQRGRREAEGGALA